MPPSATTIEPRKVPYKCCESHFVGSVVLRLALKSLGFPRFHFFFPSFPVVLEVTADTGGRAASALDERSDPLV